MKFNVLMMQPREDCTKQKAAPLGPLAALNTAIDSIGLWNTMATLPVSCLSIFWTPRVKVHGINLGDHQRERDMRSTLCKEVRSFSTWRSSGLFRLLLKKLQAQENAKKKQGDSSTTQMNNFRRIAKQTSGLLRWGLFSVFEGMVIHYVSLLRIKSRSKQVVSTHLKNICQL